jgi:hypothetical protein
MYVKQLQCAECLHTGAKSNQQENLQGKATSLWKMFQRWYQEEGKSLKKLHM